MPHRLLRNRAFQLLFLGRSLSLVGDAVVPAALSLAVLRATGSTSALALVLGCSMVPRLLLLPLGGVVADRFNARTVALTTDLVRGVTQLCIGFQLLSNTSELWQIASASAVGGAASAFAMPTLPRLITGTVPDTDRQAANSALGVVRSATGLGGPALAGVLILTVGPGWAFILDASSFAVSASLLAVIRIAHVPVGHSSLRTDLVEGWQEVRSRDWYWASLITHAVWNGAAAVLTTLGPALAIRQLGGEQTWVEILQAGAVGLLLGSLLAGRAHPRRPIFVANLGLATYALPLALFAAGAPAVAVIVAYGLALAGLGFLNPVWETSVQAAIPPGVLARVTSYDWLLSLAAMPLGYVLAPLAASAWGPQAPLWAAAAAVAVACAGTAGVPGVRRFPATDNVANSLTPATTASSQDRDEHTAERARTSTDR
ncbi:putative MFS family arabinose efflux permease [Streptomyces sp. 3212.3]|uniref:MFS transporter n=1 Tax=Streptomyces sp. 3212.3 TaxID=1938846 RepID=UPI000E269CAD|nr:MFS transporter [Streptomyces sp. 3212.3]REE58998.1 putative MFS family arabinose efflux permease [Streptomyces sp. 3212.3]